jgi:nicotinamidase-related amidase
VTTVRSVLIVIDMQNGFLNRQSEHIVPVVADLIDAWYAAGGEVVFSRYHNYPGSPFERLINWSQLRTSPEVDIVADLAARAERARAVLDKKTYTMFTPEGAALVADAGWTDLIFCGIATESCVLKSAVDAFEANLTPWLATDACASNGGQAAHEAGLLVAGRFIGPNQLIDAATAKRRYASAPPEG